MSCYELSHEPMVAKGRMVATMEKIEELMVVGHLDETIERESIEYRVPLNMTQLTTTKEGS